MHLCECHLPQRKNALSNRIFSLLLHSLCPVCFFFILQTKFILFSLSARHHRHPRPLPAEEVVGDNACPPARPAPRSQHTQLPRAGSARRRVLCGAAELARRRPQTVHSPTPLARAGPVVCGEEVLTTSKSGHIVTGASVSCVAQTDQKQLCCCEEWQ